MSDDKRWESGLRAAFGATPDDEEASAILKHRYQLGELIGRGGLGLVWASRDLHLDREVAVKTIAKDGWRDPLLRRRFTREARITGQLQHPGIVPVHELVFSDDGRPYLVMKQVRGETLASILQATDDLAAARPRLLRIFEQVCQAVAYAHARGVIHRDLKPDNVMVGLYGEVQVVDWGLAKRVTDANEPESDAPPVRGGTLAAGTPAYMAPEQRREGSGRVDARTDVYGLGATLHELLAAVPPTPDAVLPDALAPLVRRCLRSDPAGRYPDAGALAAEVGAYLASLDEQAREADRRVAAARAQAEGERKLRRRTIGLGGAVLGTLLLAGLVWWTGERARQGRIASAAKNVAASLASASAAAELRDWRRALGRADEARATAEAGGVEPDLRASVESARERYRRALARAVLVEQVDALRAGGVASVAESGREYRASFRALGYDLEQASSEALAARLRAAPREEREVLLVAIDHWLGLEDEDVSPSNRAFGARLFAAAQGADPDAWRRRVRAAVAAADGAAIEACARELPELVRPASTIFLLAKAVEDFTGDQGLPRALDVLAEGARQHPDDVWIRGLLVGWLVHPEAAGRPRRFDEAVAHGEAVVALRAGNAEACGLVAMAYVARALSPEADPRDLDVAARWLDAAPGDAPSIVCMRIALWAARGEREKALALRDSAGASLAGAAPFARAFTSALLGD
ncbi:MAG: serine/threonine-protein kinase [Planctomycetota bacterium]